MSFKFIAIILIPLFFSLSVSAQPQEGFLKSSGKTLEDVRVRVISFDEETGNGVVRFTGTDCVHCGVDYSVSETSLLKTREYDGDMNIELLKTMTFLSGSAHVLLNSRSVTGIYYVEIQE